MQGWWGLHERGDCSEILSLRPLRSWLEQACVRVEGTQGHPASHRILQPLGRKPGQWDLSPPSPAPKAGPSRWREGDRDDPDLSGFFSQKGENWDSASGLATPQPQGTPGWTGRGRGHTSLARGFYFLQVHVTVGKNLSLRSLSLTDSLCFLAQGLLCRTGWP